MNLVCGTLLSFQLLLGNTAPAGKPSPYGAGVNLRFVAEGVCSRALIQPQRHSPIWLRDAAPSECKTGSGAAARWILPVSVTAAAGGVVYAVYSIRGR